MSPVPQPANKAHFTSIVKVTSHFKDITTFICVVMGPASLVSKGRAHCELEKRGGQSALAGNQ